MKPREVGSKFKVTISVRKGCTDVQDPSSTVRIGIGNTMPFGNAKEKGEDIGKDFTIEVDIANLEKAIKEALEKLKDTKGK